MIENVETQAFIQKYTKVLNQFLKEHLPDSVTNLSLSESMQYSVFAGGKDYGHYCY